jgi:hypothetical protein
MQLSYTANENIYARFGTSGTNWGTWRKMLVENSAGNIGIGTNSPSRKLDVVGQQILTYSGAQGLTIKNPLSTNSPSEIYFDKTAAASTQGAAVGMDGSGRNFFIWVNGTDRMNIDTTGNIGI